MKVMKAMKAIKVNSDLRPQTLIPGRNSGGGACCCDGHDAEPDAELSPTAPTEASCRTHTLYLCSEQVCVRLCSCVCVYLYKQSCRRSSSPAGLLSHRADLDLGKLSGVREFIELLRRHKR